jgi:glycosyltransferase 2 family protein
MKQILSRLKPYLRWVILGGTLFFLAKAFKDHWREVAGVRISGTGWGYLAIALSITLLAPIWSGWVWTWMLQMFKQPVGQLWALQVYLKTNVAKYLPGNFWHFYGRIAAITDAGGSLGAASLSVLLEPLLMAASAVIIALAGSGLGWIAASDTRTWGLQILGLGIVLIGIHPRILNPVIQRLSKLKGKAATNPLQIESYPLLPLLGEMGFLAFRGAGFLFVLLAFMPVNINQLPQVLSAFSFAWLLGLVTPGASGGLGVFEATALALLGRQFSPGLLVVTLVLFRFVSILAEVSGALLAILSERLWGKEVGK